MNNIDNIIDYINGSNYFVVTSHISPDGDNIGSTLSMYYALNKLGKNVFYVLDDNPPLNLRFLLKDINILRSEEFKLEDYSIIALDCGDKKRICLNDEINFIDEESMLHYPVTRHSRENRESGYE